MSSDGAVIISGGQTYSVAKLSTMGLFILLAILLRYGTATCNRPQSHQVTHVQIGRNGQI
jgi:hypothetical protein